MSAQTSNEGLFILKGILGMLMIFPENSIKPNEKYSGDVHANRTFKWISLHMFLPLT